MVYAVSSGADPEGAIGAITPLKPKKVTTFRLIRKTAFAM